MLTNIQRFLQNLDTFMGPYAASMITKTTIEFVESTNLEGEFTNLPFGAVRFPRYLRAKTGYAEPYAHAIFPNDAFPEPEFRNSYLPALPALCEMIDYINDILSFYKETIRGQERYNFVCNLATTRNCSVKEALEIAVEDTAERVAEMRRVLKPYPNLLQCAEQFLCRYISWHLNTTKRYFLDEVDIRDAHGNVVTGHRAL